jgi:hypothetical protein
VWKIGSDPRILSNQIYVNAKGLLMAHKPRPEQENSDFLGDDEFHLAVQAARAEPVRYALASSDKHFLFPARWFRFRVKKQTEAAGLKCGLPCLMPRRF